MNRIVTCTANPALDLWTHTEELAAGPKLRCTAPRVDPGGGGINVSRALRRMGADTLAVFAAGGCTGERLAQILREEGVPAQQIATTEETRQSLSVATSSEDKAYRFVMPGPTLTQGEWRALLERGSESADAGSMLVASGSLPEGVPEDFHGRLARRVNHTGARLLVDSVHGIDAALDEGLFLLRQNAREASNLAGAKLEWPGDHADWAEALVGRNACEYVVITRGSEGAVLVSREERIRVRVPEIEIRSTIGAGDSFMAGLCHGLAAGDTLEALACRAVAAAAATLLTPGTALMSAEHVDTVLERCPEARPV